MSRVSPPSGRRHAGEPHSPDWLDTLTRSPGGPAVLGVVASALIAAVTALVPQVPTPTGNRADVRFVRKMSPHHAQAVKLAARIRVWSEDPGLRHLAQSSEQAQQTELRQMRVLLQTWGLSPVGAALTPAHAAAMGMATPAQLAQVQTPPVPEAERLFLRLMICHHQGAVAMVASVQTGAVPADVAALARHMQTVQTAEIRQMTRLLAARGARPWLPPTARASRGQHTH